MFHFSAAELDQFIAEDVPAFDLTTFAVTEHDPALYQAPPLDIGVRIEVG